MRNKILIVGAGHGGLVCGFKLAEQGFNVQIFEKNSRENIGWDWRDNMEDWVFKEIGIPKPPAIHYCHPENYRYLSPNEKYSLETNIPVEKRDITIERKFLVNYLIDYALQAGVKIRFSSRVIDPIIKDNNVKGIKLEQEEVYGDLIIDSSGFCSPIRSTIPEHYGMNYQFKRGDLFHTYRGFFEKVDTRTANQKYFQITLGYKNKRGISWVNTSNEYADVLIGCIDPFKKGELDKLIEDLRSKNSSIGEKLLRGGIVVPIPIRRTVPRIVGPNFALIGDSACMTIPISGSGIVNSMMAGKFLAHIIIDAYAKSKEPINENISYSAKELWAYQYQYYLKFGADNAFIDIIKNYLMTTSFKNMNYLFEKRLITANDMDASRSGGDVKLPFFDVLGRLVRSFPRFGVILELGMTIRKADIVKKHYLNIPKQYNKDVIEEWISKGEQFFKPFYEKLIKQI
ncbi:MAG: NAD(P)/FAD-dependent oxidoreductase [Promethearchaeota archaeon]